MSHSLTNCVLCGMKLDEQYSSLSYEYIDDDGTTKSEEYGKVCSKCSQVLDDSDFDAYEMTDDKEDRKEVDGGKEDGWEEVSDFFDGVTGRVKGT